MIPLRKEGNAMSYELFCQSVRGAGHIQRGMPCEDYGMKYENGDCQIFVLGDGHGDSNCPRSSFGSKAICEIAAEEMSAFAGILREQNWEERLLDTYGAVGLVNQLVMSIFGKWSCRVNEDFLENPLTENEENEAKNYADRYKRGDRIEHMYGTTFIAGLLTEQYLLLLQQGDGRCVVFDSQGEASQPIPWDDRCFANVTTSVCDEDAIQSCRYHIIDMKQNPVIACVIGSDGVEDSFGSMDKMHVFYREKLQIASESGIEALEQHLADILPDFSAKGSRDDTTICGIVNRDLIRERMGRFEADNQAVNLQDAIRYAQERMDSMDGKLQFLQKKCIDTDAALTELEEKYAAIEAEYRDIEQDIETLQQNREQMSPAMKLITVSSFSIKCLQERLKQVTQEKEQLLPELERARNAKQVCDGEYTAYKQKYDGYVQLKQENLEKLSALTASVSAPAPEETADTAEPEETSGREAETLPEQPGDPSEADEAAQNADGTPEEQAESASGNGEPDATVIGRNGSETSDPLEPGGPFSADEADGGHAPDVQETEAASEETAGNPETPSEPPSEDIEAVFPKETADTSEEDGGNLSEPNRDRDEKAEKRGIRGLFSGFKKTKPQE